MNKSYGFRSQQQPFAELLSLRFSLPYYIQLRTATNSRWRVRSTQYLARPIHFDFMPASNSPTLIPTPGTGALPPVQPLPLPDLGLTLASYEAGNPAGSPIFFLHGNSLSAQTFCRQLTAPELQRFRLLAPDLPGHGHSPDAPEFYSMPRLKQVLLAAIQALNCTEALVVGHSYGGHLLLDLLPQLPGLRGLLTIGTPPVSSGADLAAAFALNETGMLLYAPTLSAEQAQALAAYCLRPGAPADEVALLATAFARTDGRVRTALAASIQAGELSDEVGIIGQTQVPLAFQLGEADESVVAGYFNTLLAPTRWGAPVQIIQGAGHTPFLEAPADFNRQLKAFAAHCFAAA